MTKIEPGSKKEGSQDKVGMLFSGKNVTLSEVVLSYTHLSQDLAPDEDEFKPWAGYQTQIEAAEKKLVEAQGWNDEDAEKASKSEFRATMKSMQSSLDAEYAVTKSFIEMIHQLNDWKPPTKEHEGLKRGIIDSLTIRYRNNHMVPTSLPTLLSGSAYRKKVISGLKRAIASYKESMKEDIEKTRSNNEYSRLLRESLR